MSSFLGEDHEYPQMSVGESVTPSPDPVRELAEEIARDLFTSGDSATAAVADRLVLTRDCPRVDLGGWCRQAVVDRLEARLRAFLAEREREIAKVIDRAIEETETAASYLQRRKINGTITDKERKLLERMRS